MEKILISIIIMGLLFTTSIVTVNATAISYDMLIFISPQYADDLEIYSAINKYATAVKDDIGWNTKIIDIAADSNDYKLIDQIIEDYYNSNPIKACIMVGEDTNTALSCDWNYEELPSCVPWYTTGGESSYRLVKEGIECTTQKMDICISLIYPTSDLNYETKKSQIISVFNKFSENRHIYYTGDILAFVDGKIAQTNDNFDRKIYQSMGNYGDLYYKEDPSESELKSSLSGQYSMYYVSGHSCPSGTGLNSVEPCWFESSYVEQLDTPFFGASGCYVNGWWSDFPDNNRLDPSVTRQESPAYSSMIFTAPQLRVMVLGLLAQGIYPYSVSFIEHAIPNLISGKTLAESMMGHTFCSDSQTVIGDPTFRFSFDNNPPVTTCTLSGKKSIGYNMFMGPVTVNLHATDNLAGVQQSMYSINQGPWTKYSTPFTITQSGICTINYYSIDNAGNKENIKSITFTTSSIERMKPVTPTDVIYID